MAGFFKYFLVFILGFLSSEVLDIAFSTRVRTLVSQDGGSLGGTTLTYERPIHLAPTPSVIAADTIATADASISTSDSVPCETNNPRKGFDAIVETAYKRALEDPSTSQAPRASNRPHLFNLTWWEMESGLTTQGGLRHRDRALLGQIYLNASSVFEYGLGESTYMANYLGVPRYAGIDSDPQWVGMARSKVSPDYRFYLGDIGTTGAWGYPKQQQLSKNILNYQLAPLIVEPLPFDVYMVDGRWRLPVLLACFLHASARGANPAHTMGLIHDCNPTSQGGRTSYKRADHLLELVQHSGTLLCVYKRKPETTNEQLQELWHQYMNQVERR